jgi:hypothetical protein
MAKKSAPKRKADKPKPPDDSTAKAKQSTRTRKPKTKVDDAGAQAMAAGIMTVMLVAPPIQTDQFSQVQITITLTGKGKVPQCDIRASKDDGTSVQSSAFGNGIKPLLLEVMRKLGVAYPAQGHVTLGIDGNGGLIPTGES